MLFLPPLRGIKITAIHPRPAYARTGNSANFVKTLSDSQRENFEKFVKEEWKRLKGEDVINIQRFLAKEEDFKGWYQKFLNFPSVVQETDWTQHPDWEAWLDFMRNRGVPTFRCPEGGEKFGIERSQRDAIIKFAEENNLIWVGEYAY